MSITDAQKPKPPDPYLVREKLSHAPHVRQICYDGADIEPEPMQNLIEEIEAAQFVLAKDLAPLAVQPALRRYLVKAVALRAKMFGGAI